MIRGRGSIGGSVGARCLRGPGAMGAQDMLCGEAIPTPEHTGEGVSLRGRSIKESVSMLLFRNTERSAPLESKCDDRPETQNQTWY